MNVLLKNKALTLLLTTTFIVLLGIIGSKRSVYASNDDITTDEIELVNNIVIETSEPITITDEILTDELIIEAETITEITEIIDSTYQEVNTTNYSDEDIDLLVRVLFAEAGNQDEIGKRLVVDTVLNRVDSTTFPNNVHDVIYQKNQFSTAKSLFSSKIQPTDDDYRIVYEELANRYNYEVAYFKTKSYHKYGEPLLQWGAHYFNKE